MFVINFKHYLYNLYSDLYAFLILNLYVFNRGIIKKPAFSGLFCMFLLVDGLCVEFFIFNRIIS